MAECPHHYIPHTDCLCCDLVQERDAARAEVERLKVAVADLQALDHQHQQLLQPGFEILKRERDEARAVARELFCWLAEDYRHTCTPRAQLEAFGETNPWLKESDG